eukprot:scaffold32329_cov30-Tisochrysis_lutea.AAC.2
MQHWRMHCVTDRFLPNDLHPISSLSPHSAQASTHRGHIDSLHKLRVIIESGMHSFFELKESQWAARQIRRTSAQPAVKLLGNALLCMAHEDRPTEDAHNSDMHAIWRCKAPNSSPPEYMPGSMDLEVDLNSPGVSTPCARRPATIEQRPLRPPPVAATRSACQRASSAHRT